MKAKILAAALVVSCAFNIVGLVFVVRFFKLSNHYRSVKRERNLVVGNLSAVRASNVLSDATEQGQVLRRTFNSVLDGNEDVYAFMPPADRGNLNNILIVYLHGMGSNYLEPFACPLQQTIAQAVAQRYPDACLLSPSYRKEASWGSDAAMSDITQNIRALLQQYPLKRIIFMGTSMGGCTVLTYATQCPPDIKAKLCGIASIEGAGDLAELSTATGSRAVKAAIIGALGGTVQQAPAMYKRKSFLPNIAQLSATLPLAIVSAKSDNIVPPQLQRELVAALKQHGNPVKLITVDGGHGAPAASVYMDALDFVARQ